MIIIDVEVTMENPLVCVGCKTDNFTEVGPLRAVYRDGQKMHAGCDPHGSISDRDAQGVAFRETTPMGNHNGKPLKERELRGR